MFMLRSSFVLPLRASRILSLNASNCSALKMGNVLGRQMSTDEPKVSKRLLVEPLKERKLVRVHGEEVVPFLQGLISNDMKHLQVGQSFSAPSLYALFLNKSGRILYDSIIYKTTDAKTYLIECDKSIAQDLTKHLLLYRVRRNIQIDEFNDHQPWVAYDAEGEPLINRVNRLKFHSNILFTTDPRLTELGIRLLMPVDTKWPEVSRLFHVDEDIKASVALKNYTYRMHRYSYGVGEGVADLPPGKAFPLESNCDYLHGISFQKGCYIGQELTARVHHTGVVRKRLMPIKLTRPITQLLFDTDPVMLSTEGGTVVGTLRGSCGDYALGLIRIAQAMNKKLIVDGQPCNVYKPNWWPLEAPKKVPLREVA